MTIRRALRFVIRNVINETSSWSSADRDLLAMYLMNQPTTNTSLCWTFRSASRQMRMFFYHIAIWAFRTLNQCWWMMIQLYVFVISVDSHYRRLFCLLAQERETGWISLERRMWNLSFKLIIRSLYGCIGCVYVWTLSWLLSSVCC